MFPDPAQPRVGVGGAGGVPQTPPRRLRLCFRLRFASRRDGGSYMTDESWCSHGNQHCRSGIERAKIMLNFWLNFALCVERGLKHRNHSCKHVSKSSRLLASVRSFREHIWFFFYFCKGWQLMISGVQLIWISGWYPTVVFGRNMAVFSYFSRFLLWLLSTDIWLIFMYIQQIFLNILL